MARSSIRLEPIADRAGLRRFIAVTRPIYADDPAWVQPLTFERLDHLDAGKNPFLRAIEARYWNALLLPLMILQRKVLRSDEAAKSDVAPFPPWLDAALYGTTVLEHGLARLGLRYPAGGSILLVATRP